MLHTAARRNALKALTTSRSVLFAMVLVSLALSAYAQQTSPTPIRIGRTISTSQGFAYDSSIITKGFDMWVEDVRQRGGIQMSQYDGQLHPIEVVTLEDASNSQIVDNQYRALIQDMGVHVLMGPFGGSLTTAAVKRANATQTPIVYAAGSTDALFNSGYRHSFSTQAPFGERIRSCMVEVGQKTKAKTLVTIGGDDAFQLSAVRDFTRVAQEYNITRIANFTIANNVTTYDSLLELFRTNTSSRPDILLLAGNPLPVSDFIPKLRAIYDPPLVFVSNGASLAALNKNLRWEDEFIVDSTQWVKTLNYSDKFYGSPANFSVEFLRRTGEEELFLFHVSGYISGRIIEMGLENAISLTNTDIIDGIRSINEETLWGTISFNEIGYVLSPPLCEQIIGNAIRTIAPREQATHSLVYPGIPHRPPPPLLTWGEKRTIIIVFTIFGGLLLAAIGVFVFLWAKHTWHVIFIPKIEDNNEWGNAGMTTN